MDSNNFRNSEFNLREYINVIFKKRMFILSLILVASIIAIVCNIGTPNIYTAKTMIRSGMFQSKPILSKAEVVQLIRKKVTLEDIIKKLSLNLDFSYLDKSISVAGIVDTDLIEVKVSHTNADIAVDILEEINRILNAKSEEIYVKDVAFITSQLKELEERSKRIKERIASKNMPVGKNVDYPLIKNTLSIYEEFYGNLINHINTLKYILFSSRKFEVFDLPYIFRYSGDIVNVIINVLFAAMLGLGLGILIAFFQDFWKKNTVKLIN